MSLNKEFAERSNAVFDALSELVKIDGSIIFLGGSAIQATLEKPRRLSIDLDVSYKKDPEELLEVLKKQAGYSIVKRPGSNPNFVFYKLSKEGVEIKLDVSRFAVPRARKRRIRDFEVLMPDESYFLAAKLSSLAIGTIGRLEEEPVQVIKDVFDVNCILDGAPRLETTLDDWKHIVSDQNGLRKTDYSEPQCVDSAKRVLFKCIPVESPPDFFITQNTLGNFQEYLTGGRVIRRDLVTMAARALLLSVLMDNRMLDFEKKARLESGDRRLLDETERLLSKRGVLPAPQIKALKLVAPMALAYLKYWAENGGSPPRIPRLTLMGAG